MGSHSTALDRFDAPVALIALARMTGRIGRRNNLYATNKIAAAMPITPVSRSILVAPESADT
jgi:hypothetical protein